MDMDSLRNVGNRFIDVVFVRNAEGIQYAAEVERETGELWFPGDSFQLELGYSNYKVGGCFICYDSDRFKQGQGQLCRFIKCGYDARSNENFQYVVVDPSEMHKIPKNELFVLYQKLGRRLEWYGQSDGKTTAITSVRNDIKNHLNETLPDAITRSEKVKSVLSGILIGVGTVVAATALSTNPVGWCLLGLGAIALAYTMYRAAQWSEIKGISKWEAVGHTLAWGLLGAGLGASGAIAGAMAGGAAFAAAVAQAGSAISNLGTVAFYTTMLPHAATTSWAAIAEKPLLSGLIAGGTAFAIALGVGGKKLYDKYH